MILALRLTIIAIIAWLIPVPTLAQDDPERRFAIPPGHLTPVPYGVTWIDLAGNGNHRDKVIRTRLSDQHGPGFQDDIYFAQKLPAALTGPDTTADQLLLILGPGREHRPALPEVAAKDDWGIKGVRDFGGCLGLEAWLASDPNHPAMPLHLVLGWYAPEDWRQPGADRAVRFAILRLRDRFLNDPDRLLPGEPGYVRITEPTSLPRVPPYPEPYPITEESAYDFVVAARFTASDQYGPCRLAEAVGAEVTRP